MWGATTVRGARWFQVYVVPAAVFQSAMIGGGYGSGREVVEYFTRQGPLGGLMGLGVAALVFAVVLGATYDFSRRFGAYDYRHFFKALIGRGWMAYEAIYLIAAILILAVIGSAASTILADQLGWPAWVSTVLMLSAITTLAFFGRDLVARTMTLWAVLLSGIFICYFVLTVLRFGSTIVTVLAQGAVEGGWARKGAQFALYNVAIVPALLFSARAISSRREAVLAGIIGAVAAVLPALLFHTSFVARHAAIIEQPLPTYWMISSLEAPWLMMVYLIGLIGTLVQTGIGLIQGLIERIDGWRVELGRARLTRPRHALLALTTMVMSGLMSALGIVALVAEGYGALAWAFLIVYTIPLLTLGLLRRSPGP